MKVVRKVVKNMKKKRKKLQATATNGLSTYGCMIIKLNHQPPHKNEFPIIHKRFWFNENV